MQQILRTTKSRAAHWEILKCYSWSCIQELFLKVLGGPKYNTGAQTRSSVCIASALPTVISLQLSKQLNKIIEIIGLQLSYNHFLKTLIDILLSFGSAKIYFSICAQGSLLTLMENMG